MNAGRSTEKLTNAAQLVTRTKNAAKMLVR